MRLSGREQDRDRAGRLPGRRLALDRDVNTYLTAFKLPATHPTAVTLFHLLTHTGGFDERAIGRRARRAADMEPLGAYLARRMPPRVMRPGEFVSYSNHGMALAGHLIEQVSGVPFERYLMRTSSVRLE